MRIPAMVENTFYFGGNLELTSGKDANTLLSAHVRTGSRHGAAEPPHACFVTYIRWDRTCIRPGMLEEFLRVTAAAAPCGATLGCSASATPPPPALLLGAEGSVQRHPRP